MKRQGVRGYALVLLAAPVLLLAACGQESTTTDTGSGNRDGAGNAPAGDAPLPEPDENTVYQGVFTILEDDPETGPQLCSAVAESYPPQCSGPQAVGFDWAELPEDSYESAGNGASATTWGDFGVTGTWDGERLTLTETPEPATYEDTEQPEELPPRCDEPAEPWQITDPGRTTEADWTAAIERAEAAEDYAGVWFVEREDASGRMLVARFTGDDLAARATQIREVWGGPLCVTSAEHTYQELTAVSERLGELEPPEFPEFTSWSVTGPANTVTASTWVVTPALQARLDDRFGPGLVTAVGSLQPVEGQGSAD